MPVAALSQFTSRLLATLALVTGTAAATADEHSHVMAAGDLSGTLRDSVNGQPLNGGEVSVMQGARLLANVITDAFGRFRIHDLKPGTYDLRVHFIGYAPASRSVTIPSDGAQVAVEFLLSPVAAQLEVVEVTGANPVAVDTRTGNQVFKQDDYHGAPTNTTSQILQQSIVGAARAPTGEVHIRGQHGEYTYYVDGVPVLAGISGSLNELFDPSIVNVIDFQTGGWDAEYGGKNAAIINVTTRIPTGTFHGDLNGYGGSFSSNGQGLNLSSSNGKVGFFFSGTRQETDMRQEPVVFDSVSNEPVNFNNHGLDYFTFGKLQWIPGAHDVLNLDANWSQTKFAVPYDSAGGTALNDHQKDQNSFVNLGYRHRFGSDTSDAAERSGELFTGVYYRNGSLDYTPGENDQPPFVFFPDTTHYNLSEDRNFRAYGLKADLSRRFSHRLELKGGVTGSLTRGHESFTTRDAAGNVGPVSDSDLEGSDWGGYAQAAVTPVETFEIRTGIRFDSHVAPFAGNQHQWSPRVKLSWFPNAANTLYAYYGRLFVPTNVEDLRAITSIADSGVVALPTLPERDNFYELGYIHRFSFGVVTKISGYHKQSTPGIDDNTVPGTAITTSVNIERVSITGIEAVVEIRPPGPVTGYVNFALNHAYGHGPVTGGFFPTDPADVPGGYFDLDHDQRISSVVGVNYAAHRFFGSLSGIYGTGLANGAEITEPIGTGLLDFNRLIHVDPNFIVNGAVGYTFFLSGKYFRPQLYVDNIFDRKYALKGAFFSGASYGRPRSVQLKVNVGI